MKKIRITIITIFILIPVGLIGLLLFALIGPKSCPITAQELIGKYSVPLPDKGKEILELLPNGACKQDILLKDGRAYFATGTWQLDKLGSSDCISLEGVRYSLNEFGNKINPNIAQIEKNTVSCRLVTRSLMGHIKIGIYGDLGEYYHKVEK